MPAAERLAIERALTQHYLGTDSGTGAGPVRFIDASRSALAAALGSTFGVDPVRALARACDGPDATARALSIGWSARWPDTGSPGYLRFLVLTCAVVALADEAESKEFGANLAAVFGCDNIFQNRDALPELWAQLEHWCRRQRAGGALIREFVLPSDAKSNVARPRLGNVKYLRLTYEIAFPTWRDLNHLRVTLERKSDLSELLADPFNAARFLCPLIERDSSFSVPMRIASSEFRRLFEAKATLLRLHRFWTTISHVVGQRRVHLSDRGLIPRLTLKLGGGVEDAEASLSLHVTGDESVETGETDSLDGPAMAVIEQADDWFSRRGGRASRSSLAAGLSDGAVLLFESSLARWESMQDVGHSAGRCLLLLADRRRRDLTGSGRLLGRLSDEWALYGPIDGLAKAALLSRLGFGLSGVSSSNGGIRVYDGIKVGTGYLGRLSYLPGISVPTSGAVSLVFSGVDAQTAELEQVADGDYVLRAAMPIAGRLTIRLEEVPVEGIDPLVLEKSVFFVPDAEEHVRLRVPDPTRWVEVHELTPSVGRTIRSSVAKPDFGQGTFDCAASMSDLAEAIYSGGSNGWSEGDLCELVTKVVGTRGPSVWDILRTLQEAGWLSARLASTWRVRRWWLNLPELVSIPQSESSLVALRGSCPEALRRRFVATVKEASGAVIEGRSPSTYCLPPLIAADVNQTALACELRWTIVMPPDLSSFRAPACWPQVEHDPARHQQVAWWNWSRGQFDSVPAAPDGPVRLIRHRRDAGDRPDLFTVEGGLGGEGRWIGLSRTVAVLEAYRRAQFPLFEHRDGWLVRLSNDGYLPIPVSVVATLRTCRAAGPYLDGERWTYAYPVDAAVVKEVRYLFGDSLVRESASAQGKARAFMSPESVGRARARGRYRCEPTGRGTW